MGTHQKMILIVALAGCDRGYAPLEHLPCGESALVTNAADSPFGEDPTDTLAAEGAFTAHVTWADTASPLPTSWVHTPDAGTLHFQATDPDVACDLPKISLRASGTLTASGQTYPSDLSVQWATATAAPARVIQANVATGVGTGSVHDWIVDVLDEAGRTGSPPYHLRLALRDADATLVIGWDDGDPEFGEVAGLSRLAGEVDYAP